MAFIGLPYEYKHTGSNFTQSSGCECSCVLLVIKVHKSRIIPGSRVKVPDIQSRLHTKVKIGRSFFQQIRACNVTAVVDLGMSSFSPNANITTSAHTILLYFWIVQHYPYGESSSTVATDISCFNHKGSTYHVYI